MWQVIEGEEERGRGEETRMICLLFLEFLFYLMFMSYWSVVDLQCYISFSCTTRFSQIIFHLNLLQNNDCIFTCCITYPCRLSILYKILFISYHTFILPLSQLVNTCLFSISLNLFSVLLYTTICFLFYIPYIHDGKECLSFSDIFH